jgi:lipoprotein-anchoring transpeptidase ErfK/SrfK
VRALLFALAAVAALSAAPSASAQTPPPTIAPGVLVGHVSVGGMTGVEARQAVQAAFDVKLAFHFQEQSWAVKPAKFGAYPRLLKAVQAALAADTGEKIPLHVYYRPLRVRSYVAYLARVFHRDAVSSEVELRNLKPYLTKAVWGRTVKRRAMRQSIKRSLALTLRQSTKLLIQRHEPARTRTNFGPILIVKRESRRLELWSGQRFVRRFPIAVGMPAHPTPIGRYRVVMKERHPTWNPPDSPWAAGLGPVPPGPANPLGTRWIGTSAPGIGIHGTPAPSTVGTAASHGCIRMYMSDVEWLFERVRLGTPVFFVRA